MAKKKSYNPFKMWGAWVGVLVSGLLLSLLRELSIIPPLIQNNSLIWTNMFNMMGVIITGFLLGWGIHSLVRRFRK